MNTEKDRTLCARSIARQNFAEVGNRGAVASGDHSSQEFVRLIEREVFLLNQSDEDAERARNRHLHLHRDLSRVAVIGENAIPTRGCHRQARRFARIESLA
jgi:hypothetical protein